MERRKYKRTGISMFVLVRHDDGEPVGEVVNASLNGILIRTANSIPADADVDIHIQLSGTPEGKSVRFGGKVVRKNSKETGIHIEAIDMDSFLVWHEMVNRFHEEAVNGNSTRKREAS